VEEDVIRDNGYIALDAIDADSAAVIGIVNSAFVLKRSDDGGSSWTDFEVTGELMMPMFISAFFHDETHGWLGGLGAIYRTDDGTTFAEVQIPGEWFGPFPLSTATLIRSYSADRAVAVGDTSSLSGTSSVLLLVTEDGGATWTEVENALEVSIKALEVVDETRTWMAGAKGYDLDGDDWPDRYDTGTVYFSGDGGHGWSEAVTGRPYGPMAIDFLDADRGWVVGTDGSRGVILLTDDGGASWREPDPDALGIPSDAEEFAYVKIFSECEIWLIGHRTVSGSTDDLFLHSLDGGNSWIEEYDYEGESVMFAYDFGDRTTGWAGGAYQTLLKYEAETPDPGSGCDFPGGDPVLPEEEPEEPVEAAPEEAPEPMLETPEMSEGDDAADGAPEPSDAATDAQDDDGDDGETGSGCSCAFAP